MNGKKLLLNTVAAIIMCGLVGWYWYSQLNPKVGAVLWCFGITLIFWLIAGAMSGLYRD